MILTGVAAAQGAQVGEAAVDRPWYSCPTNGRPPARFYPERAQKREVDGGTVSVQCRINNASGKPTACVWLTEEVPGYGFGEAGEKLACVFRLKMPPTAASDGETVRTFPINFKVPQ